MLSNKDGDIVTDTKSMADILQDQFTSVSSNPDSPDIKPPTFSPPTVNIPFDDSHFGISNEDIFFAINDISSDSSPGPDGIPVILLKNCASALCYPLKLMWSESFNTGSVPQFYKNTLITPLYKKGDRSHAVNYRLVALTSHIIKLYERIIRGTMVKFIEHNGVLCSNQHGFRSGRSCLTQLLSHFDDIMLGLTDGADTDAIYLDYAKAFDKVDHNLILSKLRRYGFNDQLIRWIEPFLTNRDQNVVIDGCSSYPATVISGVPQVTVLGPLLFILFMNDMSTYVKHSTIRFFADDTSISKHIKCDSDVKKLQQDLDSVITWAKENNMSLHEDKFDLIVHQHHPNEPLSGLPYISEFPFGSETYSTSTGIQLEPVDCLKDLGVVVSSDLSWSPQILDKESSGVLLSR